MTSLFFIRQGHKPDKKNLRERLGIQTESLLRMAALDIPVLPGFAIELRELGSLSTENFARPLIKGVELIERETGKTFGGIRDPLLLRLRLSPNMVGETLPSVENIGLNNQTIESVIKQSDSDTAFQLYNQLIQQFSDTTSSVNNEKELARGKRPIIDNDPKALCEYYLSNSVPEFPQKPLDQLETSVKGIVDCYEKDPTNREIPASIIVQYWPIHNATPTSCRGRFTTRDGYSGDPGITGFIYGKEADDTSGSRPPLELMEDNILNDFEHIANTLEESFLDVRQVEFIIDNGRPWIVDQRESDKKSVKCRLRILSELESSERISTEQFVRGISPNELSALLFPTVNRESTKQIKSIRGGIAGSPGATYGRVFFSTRKLLETYWQNKADHKQTRLILLKKSTFAEDVQAIEIGDGVISSEGGYTSHAPIVARYLGKPSIIYSDITFAKDQIQIDGHEIKEGDYLSMEISDLAEPVIYLGKVELEYPDIETNGLKHLLSTAKRYTEGIKILANADTIQEAKQAEYLGAEGIGLCRIEHMFQKEKRIYDFRELLVAQNPDDKSEILNRIKSYLRSDFEELFKITNGKPLTARLLDAPLHEFLPRDAEELDKTIAAFRTDARKQKKDVISRKYSQLKETNPMLGHRGCRVGISFPDIYDAQVEAIIEAALEVQRQTAIKVSPRIMIPLVMSMEEMYLIKNGKTLEGQDNVKGVVGVIRELLKKHNLDYLPFETKIGAMIELPAAAISAGEIARYAEFFSFGTNDLTQTTLGLSRDDINSFLPSYTNMDIWENDPFQNLTAPVKTLINTAMQAGKRIRPDLKTGICGEHGTKPEGIRYCLETGMDYISCSPFGIPIVILTVARFNIARGSEPTPLTSP